MVQDQGSCGSPSTGMYLSAEQPAQKPQDLKQIKFSVIPSLDSKCRMLMFMWSCRLYTLAMARARLCLCSQL